MADNGHGLQTVLAHGGDGERAQTLGKPGTICPNKQAVMRVGRNRTAERLGDFYLYSSIRHVVFAANDMGDAKLNVVHDRREGVEIAAILAHQHRVRQ